jgi:hypothetical protein
MHQKGYCTQIFTQGPGYLDSIASFPVIMRPQLTVGHRHHNFCNYALCAEQKKTLYGRCSC